MKQRATKKAKAKRIPAGIKRKAAMRSARTIDRAPEIALRRNAKVDAEAKKLFLDVHLPKIAKLKAALATAQSNVRNGYKSAKADGFLQRDFDMAFRLQAEAGEKQIKMQIARDCTIAGWLGYSLGKQLDLFMQEEDSHDVEMMAYADGEEASRTGEPASPVYAPGTPGYDAYMRGFHDHQEELTKGFKKLDEEEVPVSSGVSMTRSQFRAHQIKAVADVVEERPLFTKRQEPAA
jgi:hypothetical protein